MKPRHHKAIGDDRQVEAQLKALPEFGTEAMTRKMVSQTAERVARSKETLRRTEPGKKGRQPKTSPRPSR